MTTTKSISNSENVIDSRDVIARIEALRADDQRDEVEAEELAALEDLAKEAEGYAEDWQYGAALIRDSYFEEYAREFADDIGAVNRNAKWPNTCIDWKQAAEELQMDYTRVDFDGVTYWTR